MSYNPTAIKSAIKTLLTQVTGISKVYDKGVSNIEGYPAILFGQTNDISEPLDNCNNLHTVTYTAEIYVETTVAGLNTADALLDSVVENVITKLEKVSNDTLSGVVDFVMPTSGRSQQLTTAEGVVCMKEVIINCKVATNIL